MKLTTPHRVLDRTAGLDDDVEERARELLKNWDKWQRGVSPSGAAAAAYYAACILGQADQFTQESVATRFGCTDVTVRKYYKEIMEESS